MNNDVWLKSQCNKYVNGFCSTLNCMKRGGYDRKTHIPCQDGNNKNWDLATCEPHEILLELQDLRDENNCINSNLNRALDGR